MFNPPVTARVVAIAPEIALRVHRIRPAPAGLWLGPPFSAASDAPTPDTPSRSFGYGFGAVHDYGEG